MAKIVHKDFHFIQENFFFYQNFSQSPLQVSPCVCVTRDPLRDHPDVHPAPVFGPSLQFAGQAARWTGDSFSFQGQVGIEARVSFETFSAHRTTSFLEIINDGTTAVYYDWKVSKV